jgi:hypothetical protein
VILYDKPTEWMYIDIIHLICKDNDLEISIRPLSNDVVSALTQIAQIAKDHLKVTALPDPTASGDLRGGLGIRFVRQGFVRQVGFELDPPSFNSITRCRRVARGRGA